MGSIAFNRQQGGLGRALPGNDYLSGFISYIVGSLPSGFGSSDRVKKIFSLQDAENLGIVDTFTADETIPVTGGTVQMTTPGAADEVQKITMDGGELGSYTVITADDNDAVAAGLNAAINARTYLTGWSSTVSTATVTIVAPSGIGAITTALAFATTATGAATVTQLTGGVSSEYYILHHHISEFYRMQPAGVLWVGLYAQGTYDGTEIKTVQDYAVGDIRQMAVHIPHETIATSHITASQTYADTLETENRPLSLIVSASYTGKTLATISNLSTLDSERVSAPVNIDGNWLQTAYSDAEPYSIGDKVTFLSWVYVCKKASSGGNDPFDGDYWTNISFNVKKYEGVICADVGTVLGTVALASVHQNIGATDPTVGFNLASGNIYSEAGLATGDLYNDLSIAQKSTLEGQQYIFPRTYDGFAGIYFNDSWTATLRTSDYATIENVRTMDKSVRNIRVSELPLVNSPLHVQSDGTLDNITIANFQNAAEGPLDAMKADGEISDYTVIVDPDQDVLSTSKVTITEKIIPAGVAREIENNIGFVVSI